MLVVYDDVALHREDPPAAFRHRRPRVKSIIDELGASDIPVRIESGPRAFGFPDYVLSDFTKPS
jgi:hypothetical protein